MKLSYSRKRSLTGLVFIAPWLLGFIWFYASSLVMTVRFSISDVSVGGDGYSLQFSGLKNFIFLFAEHGAFNQQLVSSIIDMLVDVPLIIFFSLLMAMLLNTKFKGRTLARAIFFLPVILNSGALQTALETTRQMMMGGMSATSAQLAESASSSIGMNLEYFLGIFGDLFIPDWALEYLVGAANRISSIITASGVQIVIFIAALQSVPAALYEVAKIEGATPYETFWKITFPMVSPLIVTNVVFTVIMAFADSQVIQTAYDAIFTSQDYALGSTMSLASSVAVCALLFAVCAILQKRTFYQN
jgi:ABC-type sugar transport system permease subunit